MLHLKTRLALPRHPLLVGSSSSSSIILTTTKFTRASSSSSRKTKTTTKKRESIGISSLNGPRRRRGRRRLAPRRRPRNEFAVLVSPFPETTRDDDSFDSFDFFIRVRKSLQRHRRVFLRVFSVQSCEQNRGRGRARQERVHVFVPVALGR